VVTGSLTTAQLIDLLGEYGAANSVANLVDAAPYLAALAEAFGDRDVRDVTPKELHRLHQSVGSTPAGAVWSALLDRKSQRWETAYALRAQGIVEVLQWESARPVRALVELFDRPGMRPRRVLELGCGDGVNAVFMAGRGCEVTAVDVSPTALQMAREKARAAGVVLELVEGDAFDLDPRRAPYDLVFDRGMFHHLPVVQIEAYKDLVADRLAGDGHLHLICHHVSTRPTVVLDCVGGFIGKLLGFLSGALIETGAGYTAGELHTIFSDRFAIESVDLVWDDNNRPLCFASAVMQRTA
jgi:2-polyprenyl-3-methyl-5-hydroxy-6-metoxy-1,4-benzoquinol methylase